MRTLFSPAQGIARLTVQAGQEIGPGDVLARVESPQIESRLEQERWLKQNQRLSTRLILETVPDVWPPSASTRSSRSRIDTGDDGSTYIQALDRAAAGTRRR